eukprot:TRINITY_DN4563_c0_g1_i1.p1 TRINITY_DN4563_c0_g1~~TRINITY_DN4563_c0_g1_i1.p1  ORF type:complete len:352 (+),score=130.55 TRINITY_DN4563_c0_g1_i1:22-1056(+)
MRFFSALLVVALAAAASATLTAHIELHTSTYVHGEALDATLTLFNPSLEPVRALTWATPLEGVRHPVLRVENVLSHAAAPYTGMLVKRGEPIPSAFTVIGAGESFQSRVNIADFYHLVEEGVHEITMDFELVSGQDGALQRTRVRSNSALVYAKEVEADVASVHARNVQEAEGIQYIGCSSSQQSIISKALSVAKSDAQQAYMYLLSGSCTGDYSTFFGAVTTSRFNTVYTHFNAIVGALNANNFEFDCSTCDMPGTYAYVYPFDPRMRINLCEVFWQAPSGSHQFNSQPGTITHETSHFNAVAGTDDIQYGVLPCKMMANSDPSKAIQNADSHEFFQEMNPKC